MIASRLIFLLFLAAPCVSCSDDREGTPSCTVWDAPRYEAPGTYNATVWVRFEGYGDVAEQEYTTLVEVSQTGPATLFAGFLALAEESAWVIDWKFRRYFDTQNWIDWTVSGGGTAEAEVTIHAEGLLHFAGVDETFIWDYRVRDFEKIEPGTQAQSRAGVVADLPVTPRAATCHLHPTVCLLLNWADAGKVR